MSTDVTWFSSADPNAPQLDGTIGSLIAVLDACLINGYGTVTVASITVTDDLATATVDAGHGFGEACVVEISGANEAAFNGRKKVTVLSATQFAFAAVGAPASATGTITAKRAPVGGWAQAFSGTNQAVYRADDGQRHFLRVFHSAGELPFFGDVTAYTAMSAVDTGDNPTTTRYVRIGGAWTLIADRRFVHLISGNHHLMFGELVTFDPTDQHASILSARTDPDRDGAGSGEERPYNGSLSPHTMNQIRLLGDVGASVFNQGAAVMLPMAGSSLQLSVGPGHVPDTAIANWAGVFATAGPITILNATGGRPRGRAPGVQVAAHGWGSIADRSIVYDPDGRAWLFHGVKSRETYATGGNPERRAALWFDLTGAWR